MVFSWDEILCQNCDVRPSADTEVLNPDISYQIPRSRRISPDTGQHSPDPLSLVREDSRLRAEKKGSL